MSIQLEMNNIELAEKINELNSLAYNIKNKEIKREISALEVYTRSVVLNNDEIESVLSKLDDIESEINEGI
jgi:hypothetical protein